MLGSFPMSQHTDTECSSMEERLAVPGWDLTPEYLSFDAPAFAADLERVRELAAELESLAPCAAAALPHAADLDPEREPELLAVLARSFAIGDEIDARFGSLRVYTNCTASVDGGNARAKELRGLFSTLGARIDQAESAFSLLLARASEPFARAALALPEAAGQGFRVAQARKYRDRLLELPEEKIIAALSPDGKDAWGRLYDAITGTAKALYRGPAPSGEAPVPPEGREIGLSEAASLLRDPDRNVRAAAYRAQSEAFRVHEESLAAILNSLSGFRLAEYEARSRRAALHFLDEALAANRMRRDTLETMLGVVAESRELGRRALQLQARLMGLPRLSCYDTLAPAPHVADLEPRSYCFDEGFELVRGAYAAIDPAMGDFVREMRDASRIEARVLPTKRPGAYCTRFPKSRTPYVFLTYRGALSDVFTLAHELGHAYHGRLLASLPLAETAYPMNLAETASTFAETALADYLDAQRGEGVGVVDAGLLEVAWADAQDAATFLVNIPARFAFEKALYERRVAGPLSPGSLTALMAETMREHYGDTLDVYDEGFWRSKLHFYMSGLTFYNFPYTFGYLFSLGVYARRAELGKGFHAAYAALLRDTGRMETEDLAKKHLGVDLANPDFWRASVEIVRGKVARFESLVASLGR